METTAIEQPPSSLAGMEPSNHMKRLRQLTLFDDFFAVDASDAGRPSSFTESDLIALAVALGARSVPAWTAVEDVLCQNLPAAAPSLVLKTRNRILVGEDPLGEIFCALRSTAERRPRGATFTPQPIVDAMLQWVQRSAPTRIVDSGIGSGRFAVTAGRKFKKASILGIEIDPLPAILARAHLAAAGLGERSNVLLADYRYLALPEITGKTLFIGNPPYVRHHLLDPVGKQWLIDQAAKLGLPASQLAGLHVHFFLATAAKAAPGDLGVFITAAEWLDVNYGSLVRDLFLGPLGGKQLVVVEPKAMPFPDADTTAVVSAFEVGTKPTSIRLKRVDTVAELSGISGGRLVRRERLEAESRWSHLTRFSRKPAAGYIELGEICRVHRGQVTGANKVWIEGPHSEGLPSSVFFRAVTKARELFRAGTVLADPSNLRRVIDLPVDLDAFQTTERHAIERFLRKARQLGADLAYTALNRKAWWSVGLRKPAPILATYMARRPPAFVENQAAARHLNIAHGLYPREPLPDTILRNLVVFLSKFTSVNDGRTYAGGLTKFEPREMERIFVPSPEMLAKAPHDRSTSMVP